MSHTFLPRGPLAFRWALQPPWALVWLGIVLSCVAFAPVTATGLWAQVGPTATPPPTSADVAGVEPVRIRRLFVPEARLTEFMRDRPTYLPLSAERFRAMISALEQPQQRVISALPLRHWVVVSSSGNVQGYSLLRTQRGEPGEGAGADTTDTWVSLEDWSIAAEFFNLVPTVLTPRDSGGTARLRGLPRAEYQEVPLTVSVNEAGVFGAPLADTAEYLLVRYNVNVAAASETSGLRALRLPNSAETITVVQSSGAEAAELRFAGSYEAIQTVGPAGTTAPADPQWQVVFGGPELILPAGYAAPTPPAATTVARYTEHSSVALTGSVGRYESIVTLEFPSDPTGELVLELPAALELTGCEVNGVAQPLAQRPTANGNVELLLPSQRWNVSNTIRVTGTLPLKQSERVTIPRIALPGHVWLQGNLQVTLDAPLRLIDYELVDSRLASCQTLGSSQNLSFQWGGPQSSVTVVVDSSAAQGSGLRPTAELTQLMVDHETMEAEHWLVIPYRHRATRVGKMMVEEGWQIEQVAAVAWRDLPDFGAADSAETLTTPLNWFLDADTSPVQLNFELPEQWSEAEIALRVKASRAVTEWPARTPGRVVAPIAPPTAGFRPLGLALRGVATLKPMLAENRHWYAVPAAQADQQVGVLSRVVGGGTLWLSGGPDALSLETESGPVGGYGVLAYTQNQGRPSGLVQQWHRLLIQPSGPVPEVVLRPTGLPAFNRRWHAWNQAGQAVPMEVQWDAGQEEARVRFRTPIIEPISLVVQQQWDSRVPGNLPLWETPSASGFWGVVDTVADREPGLRVWPAAETSAVVDPTRLQAFRQSSRRGFHGWTALPAFSENAGTELAAPRFEAASDEGLEPLGYFSSLVYRAPAVLRFQLEKRPKPWSSTTIVQATQIDVWSNSVWSTELDVELFLDAADDLVFDLPAQAQVTQVLLNQQPLEWRLSENRLEVSVPRPGRQLLSIVWQTPLQSGFAWGRGLFAVPEAMDLPRLSQPVTRALHLPAGVIPVPSSSPGIETGVSWSRRLISPLAWPDGDLGGLGDNAAAIVSQPVPPAENAVAPGRRVRPQWQLWPLRPASTDGPQWVVVPRDFRLQCWLALLVGWGLASVGSSGSWRAWLPWANPTWLIGGLCLCLTAWAAWPFHYLTSTVLLGFLLGHSWWAAWQVVREQRSPPQSPAAGPPSVPGDGGRQWPSGRSPQGLGSGGRIPATTLGWLGWLLAFAAVAVDPAGLIAMSGAGGPRQEPRSEGSLRTASDEPEGEMPGPFQSVVIPVDADQRPAGNVVYVSPELYRQLSQWTTTQRRSRDLEIRNVQYTLDYDPQLQRFAQLTSQLTCRTQTARHFRLPYAAGQQDAIRQVRVNGVPVVYERFDDRIEIFLDAAANLISITSDLQSTGAVTLSLPGTTDTAINLRGIPSGRYASVTDQERPSFRFLSPTQRRFRVDRMKRVVLQVADQAPATQEPTCELWLTANSQKIDCEMRFSAPRLLGIRRDFYFQVDPRLNLPPGVASEGATWTIDRVPDEQRPSTAAAGPVYRIRFAPDHPPTQRVQVAWDFTGRNFGQLTPPWVQFLDQEGWGIQQWVVLRVAKNLVYHPQDLTMTAYRRASEFEWRAQSGVGNRAAAERGPVGLDRLMTDLNRSGQESIVTNDLFVYQVQNQQARHLGGVLGRLAWQPVQVAGSLQQQVLVDELSARISVKGEIQVVQGELSQWRFRAPAGGKLLQLSWLAGAENLVAWHTRRAGPQYDELVVFLRAPVSGSTRLDCLYEVPIYAAESPELPWISFPSWMDVSQSLQVEIVNLPSWNLLLPNIGAGRETDTTNSTGQATFLISAETTPQIDQVKLVRNGESTVTGSGLYLWDSERMPAVLRLSLGLSSKSSLRKLTLEPIQGLGLPTTVRAVDAAGSGIELSPWQRIDSTFQAELAAPLGTIRVDLEIPVLDGDQEIGLPTVKDGARDLVRYFAVAPGEDAAAVVGGNPAPLLDNGWQVVQPLAATSVWHEQWAAARGWMRIDDSSREPPRLTLRPTPGDNRSAATLGNRFFLRQAVVEQDARQVRIAGVQQMVLQTLGKDEVLIAAPPGVELHHGWLDHHRLPLPAPSNTDPPQIRVPLDPLAEYAVLTWVLSATLTPEQSKLELPHLAAADAKTFSVHLWTADGRLPEPLATITRDATSPTGDEDSGNVAAILEQKYGEPSWLAWSQAAPAVHPLKALEPLRMAPEPSQLAGLEVRLDAAAVDNQRPTSWGAWITGGIGGLLLCVWLAGIVRPFSLPSPAAWGDVVWILLGSVAWFASAELPVVVLFWTIGFSWLALRAFPESFSRRVA